MFASLPEEVTVYEVGPRDGLQNEKTPIPSADKVRFIQGLVAAGLKRIEVTSFVHPRWIPQLADAEEVCRSLPHTDGNDVRFTALVPNLRGLERALKTDIQDIAIFLSASETHTKKNIGRTIDQALDDYRDVVLGAKQHGRGVRGYVSTVFGCPYEGAVEPKAVFKLVRELKRIGVDEVSLGDTIGVATPKQVYDISRELIAREGAKGLALHLHNTRGTALSNVVAGIEAGICVFDASAGGLGGCPYAPGASGNLATEDLVYMLHGMGIRTGVDLVALARASMALEPLLGHELASNVTKSLASLVCEAPVDKAPPSENPLGEKANESPKEKRPMFIPDPKKPAVVQ
jgi:hydroxymethylglutaryl-CoA lyase